VIAWKILIYFPRVLCAPHCGFELIGIAENGFFPAYCGVWGQFDLDVNLGQSTGPPSERQIESDVGGKGLSHYLYRIPVIWSWSIGS